MNGNCCHHTINAENHLVIGGTDAVDLAKAFSTPLIVYDVDKIRANVQEYHRAFQKHIKKGGESLQSYHVAYASKALSIKAIYEVMQQEGVCVDVVSGGELYTALQAGVPGDKIHFHGNNKSEEEVLLALRNGVGCFVVDNFYEIDLLKRLSRVVYGKTKSKSSHVVMILLRVSPGVTAHTHEHNTTGQVDSKFGLDIASGQAKRAFDLLQGEPHLRVVGLHCHIGSQIFMTEGHSLAARRLLDLAASWGLLAPRSNNNSGSGSDRTYPFVLNVGGGYGIRYTDDDTPLPFSDFIDATIETVTAYISEMKAKLNDSNASIPFPELWIEPGRSLVGEAGTTLYTVGAHKHVPGIRDYLSVDGGMSDNIRPVLYDAVYEAALANRMKPLVAAGAQEGNGDNDGKKVFTVVGKLCETGDQLIKAARLPADARAGDTLAMFCTGAYGYAMASNYNRICRPAVVFVEKGKAPQVVVRRETYDDLVSHDVSYINSSSNGHKEKQTSSIVLKVEVNGGGKSPNASTASTLVPSTRSTRPTRSAVAPTTVKATKPLPSAVSKTQQQQQQPKK